MTTPRKLNPNLPTDPRHYKDCCVECEPLASSVGLTRTDLIVVPEVFDETIGRWRYFCPRGHEWTCSYAQQSGYFSDCVCRYCYEARRTNDERHWPPAVEYDRHSAAFWKIMDAAEAGAAP